LGESIVVTGLGLVGLLAVQILRAHGCQVLGIDLDPAKCNLARQFGATAVDLSKAEDLLSAATVFSHGRGVDGVLITASTPSNEPVHQAATICRKRGRIVLVGVTGLELSRADFYEKELTFQVSCSYGPGRYDESYEQKGHDYPIGFVRWTEQRNFEAVLDLMADRKLNVQPLISHRFGFEEALKAYEVISDRKALGILLEYGGGHESRFVPDRTVRVEVAGRAPVSTPRNPIVGVIGAGSFSAQVLLPALKSTGARLKAIASSAGVSGTHLAKKFGFEFSTTDPGSILSDPEINTVFITTRHDSHARFVISGLSNGKAVFVEKPLCLNARELAEIIATYETANMSFLMTGFNRRFAPHVVKIKNLLAGLRQPKAMIMTVNAGVIPADHWTQDPEAGGGRIIGEACHYIDLLRFLSGSSIAGISAARLEQTDSTDRNDKVSFTMTYLDGSMGTVHYLANGHKSFPKEQLEVFCAGRILKLDNFRRLTGFGWPGFKQMNLWRQNKGHQAEMQSLISAVRKGGPSPISFSEIVEVTRASFEIADEVCRGSLS
jgi:predicted dehydrogenase